MMPVVSVMRLSTISSMVAQFPNEVVAMSKQLKQNVRNFLYPLTLAEMRDVLELSIEAGDTVRAGYVEEFIREVEAETLA